MERNRMYMSNQLVPLFVKIRIWIFDHIIWRIVYRFTLPRKIFNWVLPLFFKNVPKTRCINDQSLNINPNRSVVEMRLHALGTYEPEVIKYFNDYLEQGMTFIDVGANIGFFSLIAADIVGKKGKVIAYEPHPDTYEELCANITLNDYDNIIPKNVAISSNSGKLNFNTSSDHAFNSIAPQAGSTTIEVNCQTLDASLQELDVRNCNLIKMDIEGAELFAIQGIDKTLANHPKVSFLIELHHKQINKLGGKSEDIYNYFTKNQYKLYELDMWKGIVPFKSNNQRIRGHLLCIRK